MRINRRQLYGNTTTMNRPIRRTLVSLLIILTTNGAVLAEQDLDLASAGGDEEMLALLATLDEATEIATKTRMNSDYVPGAVSVLRGEELENLGVATVWDALGMVAGLQTTRTNFGEPLVLVRGAGYGLHSGNLKIMLNSVPVNNDINGHAFSVLKLPVEQVERIDVFRGPGSALYGEYAYAGVVNVITRKTQNRAYVKAASHDNHGAGAMLHYQDEASGFKVYGNLGGWHTDGAGTDSGPDRFFEQGLGASPGEVDDEEGNRFALLGMDYSGYNLMVQYTRRDMGEYFGLNALPLPDRREAGHTSDLGFSLDKTWNLFSEASLHGRLVWQEHTERAPLHTEFPRGTTLQGRPGERPFRIENGAFSRRSADTRRYGADTELNWNGWNHHRLFLGVSYANIEITDAWLERNVRIEPPPRDYGQMIREFNTNAWVRRGNRRELYSLTLQDQWDISDPVELTGGLRLDRYSDVGNSLTPRLAAVWRLNDQHVLKAQYAEAFRPPTLSELYEGSTVRADLEPETLASTEVSYIYRGTGQRGQISLFHTRLEDLIRFQHELGGDPFVNAGEIRMQGVELEWEQGLAWDWNLQTNLSFTDTRDRETGERVPGSAEWLANAGLEGPLWNRVRMGLHWNYVGERARWADDDRSDLDGYQTLDLTLSWIQSEHHGWSFRTGIDNLFDEEIRALAAVDTYQEDLPQPGRSWWLQAGYRLD